MMGTYEDDYGDFAPAKLTVTEITETSLLQKEFNRGLMVKYINDHLLEDGVASLDVRTSTVLYDEDKDFVMATNQRLNDLQLRLLFERTKVRYFSKGIV